MTPDQTSTYDRALKLLAFRARSTSELRRQLLRKGEPATDVEAAITRLREQKYLDDADFARQFARTKLLAAGASRRRIVQELARRGVTRDVAEQAIEELRESDGVDPAAAVRRVAEKKWRSLARFDDFTRRRRLYAFLARRGFHPDEIRTVMTALGEAIDL
jgi:regulatory protein